MQQQLISILQTIGPILFLLFLGILIRKTSILEPVHIAGLQTLVVKIVLPAALFLTFLRISLHWDYVLLPLFIFLLCALTYGYGLLRQRLRPSPVASFPFLMSSFEFGMLGITLYAAAFGESRLGNIAIMGLGQEFFVWFIMIPAVAGLTGGPKGKNTSRAGRMQILKSFLTNPALVGIFIGLALNVSGFNSWGENSTAAALLISSLQKLTPVLVPAILIIIGYNMDFKPHYIRQVLGIFTQRSLIMVPLSIAFIIFILQRLLGLEIYFTYALITLLILPPPFVIPLFLPESRKSELAEINGILMAYTLLTIALFILFIVITSL